MVSQGSTAIRGVVERGKAISANFETPCHPRFYAVTDGGGDRRVDYLSVQKSLVALFLYHNLDEVIAMRTATGLSYRNPVERVHSVANLGLQCVGMMRQRMSPELEKVIKHLNSNEELRKACANHPGLEKGLAKSLAVPIDLFKKHLLSTQPNRLPRKKLMSIFQPSIYLTKESTSYKETSTSEVSEVQRISSFTLHHAYLLLPCVQV